MGRSARLAGIAIASIVLAAGAAWFLLPLGVRAFVRGLVLVVDGCVWFAASVSAGADAWTILKAVGRAAGTALTSTETFMIVGGWCSPARWRCSDCNACLVRKRSLLDENENNRPGAARLVCARRRSIRPGGRMPPDELKRQAGRRFEVVVVRDGLVLRRNPPGPGPRTVEVTGGQIIIDGAPATGAEVRENLRGEADLVLQLLYLTVDEQRFALQRARPDCRMSGRSSATAASRHRATGQATASSRPARTDPFRRQRHR